MLSIRFAIAVTVLIISAQVVHGDLVAHWRLNEGEGDIFTDSVGGNDGFLPEDVTVEWADDGPIDGILETSVLFTGDDGPSYIETPFLGIGGNNPRTITAWIKAEPQSRATAVVAYGSLENGRKWHFRIENTRIRTEFMGGQNFGGDTDAADGEWHHIASVFPDGGTVGDDIIHYVDGIHEPKLGGTSRDIDTGIGEDQSAFPVHIGFAAGHAGRFFQGQIADVRIYDEELDGAAIQDIINGGGFLPPGAMPGDFNSDGIVDVADFQIMSENFNTRVRNDSFSKGDFDLNLRVDLHDFLKFRQLLESQQALPIGSMSADPGGNGRAATVPEPNYTSCVVLLGLIWALRRSSILRQSCVLCSRP